mmetsp:Transcript_90514/g.180103  ORF Transcript_90514/g.180103 Transcript_90514/m.180103 type:complete len:94 (+) Transcript_90514:102-383(+)
MKSILCPGPHWCQVAHEQTIQNLCMLANNCRSNVPGSLELPSKLKPPEQALDSDSCQLLGLLVSLLIDLGLNLRKVFYSHFGKDLMQGKKQKE